MGQAAYRYLQPDFREHYSSIVTTPYHKVVEPERMYDSLHSYVQELLYAARAGFDGIAVSEHSQSSYDISPNPNLAAAIVAHTAQVEGLDTAICLVGRSLGKAREPLKIAEEYAVLDVLSGGRLIAGLPVGLSYDANQNGGIPPIETRLRYREGRALLEKAWSATEPFAWNGKYSRYAWVNIWPRPVQQPRPPFWVPSSSGSPGTLADIVERDDVFTFVSWFGVTETARRIYERYWQLAEERGRDRNPYKTALLQTVMVSDTDADAERLYADHVERHFRNSLGSIPAPSFALPGYVDPAGIEHILRDPGDLGLAPKLPTITFRELVDTRAVICGGVDTVREQIEECLRDCRIGNLLAMLHVGSMPHELVRHNIDTFANGVLPHLRGIWEDEAWEHRWWPTGIQPPRPSIGRPAGAFREGVRVASVGDSA
jgi:alkanesulfonate monooxygenase SsuD/methylene tetrahydromethanopterin reductase-like flavin-dependent oxidoreductase (luciferase family)